MAKAIWLLAILLTAVIFVSGCVSHNNTQSLQIPMPQESQAILTEGEYAKLSSTWLEQSTQLLSDEAITLNASNKGVINNNEMAFYFTNYTLRWAALLNNTDVQPPPNYAAFHQHLVKSFESASEFSNLFLQNLKTTNMTLLSEAENKSIQAEAEWLLAQSELAKIQSRQQTTQTRQLPNQDIYQTIEIGMTQAQVKAIAGSPLRTSQFQSQAPKISHSGQLFDDIQIQYQTQTIDYWYYYYSGLHILGITFVNGVVTGKAII